MSNAKKKLSPRQLKALDLILSGLPLLEVAQQVGVVRQTVSQWKNQDQEFKAQLERLMIDVEDELRYSAPMREAFMRSQLCKLATEGSHENRLKAALAYLDRFGSKPPETQSVAGLNEADELILRVMHGRRAEPVNAPANARERR